MSSCEGFFSRISCFPRGGSQQIIIVYLSSGFTVVLVFPRSGIFTLSGDGDDEFPPLRVSGNLVAALAAALPPPRLRFLPAAASQINRPLQRRLRAVAGVEDVPALQEQVQPLAQPRGRVPIPHGSLRRGDEEEIRERVHGGDVEHARFREDTPVLALLRSRGSRRPGLHARSAFILRRRLRGRKRRFLPLLQIESSFSLLLVLELRRRSSEEDDGMIQGEKNILALPFSPYNKSNWRYVLWMGI